MKLSLSSYTLLALTLAALLRHRRVEPFMVNPITITTIHPVRYPALGTGTALYNRHMVADDDDSGVTTNDDAKVCLITGASRGIGKCIALELFKAGKNVKIVLNDIESMNEEMEKVRH